MSVAENFKTMNYGPAPESTAEAMAWLDQNQRDFGLFIDGEFIKPKGRKTLGTINPATGGELAHITMANSDDVDRAAAAARKAQKPWEKLGGSGRARHLYALARLVQKHARLLSVIESLDNGKPIRESRDIDIPLVARHFYHHAGWAQISQTEMAGYEAIGVAGQVIPWNFPLLMLSWKIAPALAMGNTVVLKPAELTSLSALLFAELCQQAGLPKGVVNIITGDGSTGELIVTHDDVDKVAFTGSTAVGRHIREQTAGSGKKLTLELGGKSPFIVFDDADLDSAVEGIVDAIWFNQGQVCCAGSRLLVQENIAEKFYGKLRRRMETLRVGDPLDKTIDVGAIVSALQLERIEKMVIQGVSEGAKLIQADTKLPDTGFYFPPTLLCDVETSSTVAQEEIFGPVLVAMTFRTPTEAIQLANNTKYGLAASVWTENINLSLHMASKIVAGVVWLNCTNQFDAAAGFGGRRESGFGREGGREGLFEYVVPSHWRGLKSIEQVSSPAITDNSIGTDSIDRTAKLYVGGKQARPDSGYSREVISPKGKLVGLVGEGNRKDIRNAVEAAASATSWSQSNGHTRAQILYYIAENLAVRKEEFEKRLRSMTGATAKSASAEVEKSIDRLFTYAAWADKYDGAVHSIPMRGVALAMNEPCGIIGIVCPDKNPLLGFISLIAPAITTGNRVVVVPSQTYPLAVTDFYQVLETSDLPGGVVNIVTGNSDSLAATLADHYQIDAIWYHGSHNGSADIEKASAANLKRTWVNDGKAVDWFDTDQGEGREFLRQASQIKNIWAPYGE